MNWIDIDRQVDVKMLDASERILRVNVRDMVRDLDPAP